MPKVLIPISPAYSVGVFLYGTMCNFTPNQVMVCIRKSDGCSLAAKLRLQNSLLVFDAVRCKFTAKAVAEFNKNSARSNRFGRSFQYGSVAIAAPLSGNNASPRSSPTRFYNCRAE